MATSASLLLPPNPSPPAFASPLPIRSLISSPSPPRIDLAVNSDHYCLHVPTQIASSRVLHPGHIFSISPFSSPAPSICCGADSKFNLFQHSVGPSFQTCRAQSSSTFVPNKQTKLHVPVSIDDSLAANGELQALVDRIQLDGPMALKLALDNLKDTKLAETIELSVMICSDDYIQGLNREWRGENTPTDVLSFPQEQPPGLSSTILLGDVIISFETATRQAEERAHSLLDEMRILLLHGLLHVLGYDHEEGLEAAKEMEHEESRILRSLGWKGNGLISAAFNDSANENGGMGVYSVAKDSDMTEEGIKAKRTKRPPFRVLFCDMDGTLLNSHSKVTEKTSFALKEAIARGVKVIIATGKSRPAAMSALQHVGLVGENGALSVFSPGVFLQGLLVYGQGGCELHKEILAPDVCAEAFQFSLKHRRTLVGFSGDRTVSLFEHSDIDALHTIYMEPKC